jgi:hypothetical protein
MAETKAVTSTKMPNSMEHSITDADMPNSATSMNNSPRTSIMNSLTNDQGASMNTEAPSAASMNTEAPSTETPSTEAPSTEVPRTSIMNNLTNNTPTNYDEDVSINENIEPDRSSQNMSLNDTESAIPEERPEEEMPISPQPQGETVDLEKEVDDVRPIIMHVIPHKGHHFKLHARDEHACRKMIEEMGYTVEFPTEIDTPDVIVSNNDDVICKVHFLLCDKKDGNNKHRIQSAKMALYYIHLYFFASFDPTVKDAIVGFFTDMATAKRKSSSRMSSSRKSSSRMSSSRKSSSRMSSTRSRKPSSRKSSTRSRKSPSYKPSSSNKYLLAALSPHKSHTSKTMRYPKRYHKTRRGKTHRGKTRHRKTHHGKTRHRKTWHGKKRHHTHK